MSDEPGDVAPDPKDFTDPSPNPEQDVNLAVVGDVLQEQDVQCVVIRYSGRGDEGSIEEVEFTPDETTLPPWVEDQLRDAAEGYCPDGYENNEGSYGTLTLYPFLGLAELEHNDRVEGSEDMDVDPVLLPENLHQELSALGIVRVHVHFDGYGDSGQIDQASVEPDHLALEDDLAEELEDFLMEQIPSGWENNEGGFGDFTVDAQTAQVAISASWRVEETESQVTRWNWRS